MADPRKLVIRPEKLVLTVNKPEGEVTLDLLLGSYDADLVGIGLAIRMTAAEARQLAAVLVRKADELDTDAEEKSAIRH